MPPRLGRHRAGHAPGASKATALLVIPAAFILILSAAGCGAHQVAAAGQPQPPVPSGQTTQGPDLSGIQLPDFVMPVIRGGVSLPNRQLTPGAVSAINANAVCDMQVHTSVPHLSPALTAEIYAEYGESSPAAQAKHIIDWLVPYSLGGAGVQANLWPAAVNGTGFYQKVQTDDIMRQMVCRNLLTLAQAQHALETNWYTAWLRYVVVAGHL